MIEVKIGEYFMFFDHKEHDIYDNPYYKWCPDDVEIDNDITYNEFIYGPDHVLDKGKTLYIDYLWFYDHTKGEISQPKAYFMVADGKTDLKNMLNQILARYHMDAGCKGGRFYYIENVIFNDDGLYEVVWGT